MADDDGYLLSQSAAEGLGKMYRWWQRNARNYHPPRSRRVVSIGGGTNFRRVEFTLPSALTASGASVAGCTVVAVWYGVDPGTTVTVYNDYGWEADAGATGIADFRPTDSHWVIVLLPCATGTS